MRNLLKKNKLLIQDVLKVGQKVLVQGIREEMGNKCAAFSMNLKLRGRFMILLPHQKTGGVSKKIANSKEQERLKIFLDGLKNSHKSCASVIRSVSEGRSLSDLKKDFITLKGQYQKIWKQFLKVKGASLIQSEPSPAVRILRDDFSEDFSEVCVDHPETFQEVQQFFKQYLPTYQKNVKLYLGNRSLFTEYEIERQVEALQSNRVALPSGGSIVIDQTEALVAIDVNSGSSLNEENVEETALNTNLEAAEEVARQLRLRNLGGLVVIDFIDMMSQNYRKNVVDAVILATKKDRAQIKLANISRFGLLEMSRQRLDSSVVQNIQDSCFLCRGTGLLPTMSTTANDILRKVREMAALENIQKIRVTLDHAIANYLFNNKRSHLDEIEVTSGINILLEIKPAEVLQGQPIFEILRNGQTKYRQFVFRDKPLPVLSKPEETQEKVTDQTLQEGQIKKVPHLKVVSETKKIEKEKTADQVQKEVKEKTSSLHIPQQQKKEENQTGLKGVLFASVHRPYPDGAVPLPEIVAKKRKWQNIPLFTTIYCSQHEGEAPIVNVLPITNLESANLIESINDEDVLASPKKKKAKATSTKKKSTTKKKTNVEKNPVSETIKVEEAEAKQEVKEISKKKSSKPKKEKAQVIAKPSEETEKQASFEHIATTEVKQTTESTVIESINDEEVLTNPKKKEAKTSAKSETKKTSKKKKAEEVVEPSSTISL